MKIKFPLVVIGSQWGDEGKGKIVDILSSESDYVVRYNGGNNAGHTVVINDQKFKLSLLPSGVLHHKKLLLAQGVVIDPKVLIDEIDFFKNKNIKINLTIDPRVNIVMPYHKAMDRANELWKGKKATGSLHLGIGYCYEDKNNRAGVRFEDLINPHQLKSRLEMIYQLKKDIITKVYKQKFDISVNSIYCDYLNYGRQLKKYVGDVSQIINQEINKKKILFEGAHGTFLDGVFGTFPYTTAVYTISSGVLPYVGLPPQKIYSIGIVKAYTTRVGNGPFPTELFDKIGDKIRDKGHEYGTVSKRPRRIGWLDLAMLKTSVRLNGFDYLAVTKLDVLSGLDEIKVGIKYQINHKNIDEMPSLMNDFADCRPIYKVFKGWKTDISKILKFKDLPINAQKYIKFIENYLQVKVKIVSVGADRNANIIL